MGLNFAAEGPFNKTYKGSYLFNYRYSTLALLRKMGILSNAGTINYQDLSYNIYLPTKRFGTFTLFGIGGLSGEKTDIIRDSTRWESIEDRFPPNASSNMGVAGLTHQLLIGNKTNIKSSIAYSKNIVTDKRQFVEDDYSLTDLFKSDSRTRKSIVAITANHRPNKQNILRLGIIGTLINFKYYQLSKSNPIASPSEVINAHGKTQTLQGFTQWQNKSLDKLTFNVGVHFLRLFYNNTSSVEPRLSLKWDISRRTNIALAYGLHSQMQVLGVYFAQLRNPNGSLSYPNRNLDLTKSHHFVLSHQYLISKDFKVRTELYYQKLYNVPVGSDSDSTLSTLNIENEYIIEPLVNKGKGKNYGAEVSFEKYLSKTYYFMFSNSVYQSKYTAIDKVERSTRFNGNYTGSLLFGKEISSKANNKIFGLNLKAIYAKGLRTTPIDESASLQQGYEVYKDYEAFSLQNPAYFRTDIRLSMKWNRKRFTSVLSLDIQNVTARLNVYNQWFDFVTKQVRYNYQNGIIPVINYRIEF